MGEKFLQLIMDVKLKGEVKRGLISVVAQFYNGGFLLSLRYWLWGSGWFAFILLRRDDIATSLGSHTNSTSSSRSTHLT